MNTVAGGSDHAGGDPCSSLIKGKKPELTLNASRRKKERWREGYFDIYEDAMKMVLWRIKNLHLVIVIFHCQSWVKQLHLWMQPLINTPSIHLSKAYLHLTQRPRKRNKVPPTINLRRSM
jgi:hypothetical protein